MPKTQVGTITYMAPEVTMINKRGSGVQVSDAFPAFPAFPACPL